MPQARDTHTGSADSTAPGVRTSPGRVLGEASCFGGTRWSNAPRGAQPPWCGGTEPAGSDRTVFSSRGMQQNVPTVPLGPRLQPIIAFFLGASHSVSKVGSFLTEWRNVCFFFFPRCGCDCKGVTHLHRSFTGGRWMPPPRHVPGGWETGLLTPSVGRADPRP